MIARRIPVALAATSLLFGAACGSEASEDINPDTGPGTGDSDTGGGGADAGGIDSGGADASDDTTPEPLDGHGDGDGHPGRRPG